MENITPSFQGHIETLVSHFSFSPTDIQTASLRLKSLVKKVEGQRDRETEESIASTSPHLHLWDICRNQARPRLDELAQRIEPSASWNDLVLPEKEERILHEIVAHVAQRTKVYKSWGFGSKSGRGLGISALFSGASGTGKTTAAELLAKELRLDLYRIDLSSIVNKYIGETEKNLRRVFDAAETGGVILLFDEADALFGKRSEIKDSHDRYANMEVSYLLQRIESYRGLAILTTNLKSSIDQAFLRRLRFVVQFPFPDANQRAEIWQRVFPSQTPTEGLDFTKLAQLSVTGGNIRNIALNAAFIAANTGESLEMKHILQATRNEYIKLERSLTDTEINSWV
ncbi:ATP-binding protein [Nostoc sp.]|uniref:ATP-binding protein n=1 Tax=Nostoc sp. TaxID=1180 RepID=UPI002FFAD71D